jgi:hypothetical protein
VERTHFAIQVTKPDNGSIVPTRFRAASHDDDEETYKKAFDFLSEAVKDGYKVELIKTVTIDNNKGQPV